MQKVLSAEEMREVDRLTTEKYVIPSILLMENAAHSVAKIITEKLGGEIAGKSFLILCGKGNNGGDGAALARILWTQGANCFVYLFGKVEETKGDARSNFEILKKIYESRETNAPNDNCLIFYEDFKPEHFDFFQTKSDVVVDALFGTGLTRPIAGKLNSLVKNLNFHKKRIGAFFVSLDIPSGLNSDVSEKFTKWKERKRTLKNLKSAKLTVQFAEEIGEHIRADLTVTFTAPKLANVFPPASNFNGELFVTNIGSPRELIDNSPSKTFIAEKSDAHDWLEKTKYTSDSYKNKRGHALLITGSKEYTGAAVLAGNSAMLSGVGLTTIATSESAQTPIAAKVLEEIITRGLPETRSGAISEKAFDEIEKLLDKTDAIGIGCGLGAAQKTTKDFVREVVTKRKTPIVIDADGLNALAPFDLKGNEEFPVILTPHEGEFLRLLGTTDKEILKDRVKIVRGFAEKHKVILVLKGERVLIAAPDGRVVINPTGNSGLGKAGNGDTLTGIITGFVAQAVQMEIDIFETVLAAIYISSLAGDIAAEKFGRRSMLAGDVRECLGEAFSQLKIKR